ncbi:uncharacterized protein EV420DRAFT_649787 [Desarmillaria tabescens]|uniref:Protein kinase domain-containing protein n=1 Tax=Armillaria tabescens TaxID=1929756 RepID=A0AA39TUH1_ARMTA|nr:uncharacterized protein EV420DRAFT_649787 [Desarmillaria tabescens]KAK0466813.1 hypothetical protein EV420DRAFT_649787 [Desarmillaria tabescens]
MDPKQPGNSLSTANRVAKLIGDIHARCSNYRAVSETIQLTESCLECVQTRLDIFHEYLRRAESTLSPRAQSALLQSLQNVEDLLFELGVQLSPNIVMGRLKWIEPRKRRIKDLVFEIRMWVQEAGLTIRAYGVLLKITTVDLLYQQLLGTYHHSLTMDGHSLKMYDHSLTSALALARRIHNRAEKAQPPLIPNSALRRVGPAIKNRAFATLNNTDLVYAEAHCHVEDSATRNAIERMAAIFYGPDFPFIPEHLLPCIGFAKQYDGRMYFLIYQLPPMSPKPDKKAPVPTLANALCNGIRMALEDRFRIAAEVTMAVLELHAVGWVHQAICSDNVLLSTKGGEKGAITDAQISSAYLIGFKPVHLQDPGFPKLPAPNDFAEQGDVRYDLYHLGAVLVEIGFGQTLGAILSTARTVLGEPKRGETEYERLKECARRLGNKMGSKYANAAMMCLLLSRQPKDPVRLRERLFEDVLCLLRQIMDGFKAGE